VAAAVLGLVVLGIVLAVAGGQRSRHLLGTNNVRPFTFGAVAGPGQTHCQIGEVVPKRTSALRLRLGTYGALGPRATVTISAAGSPTVRGALPSGWHEGDVIVPVSPVRRELHDARLCIANQGRTARVAAAGESVGGLNAQIGTQPQGGRIRAEYLAGAPQSWWEIAPWMAARVGLVRGAFPGGAALVVWALVTLGIALGAVSLVLREARR
jgi:hypothetical protein